MADIKISQLETAASADNGDLFVTAKEDASSATGYKTYKNTLAQIAAQFANSMLFPSLTTTEKTLVGAINEVYERSDKVKQSPVTSGTYRILLQKTQSNDTVKTEETNKNAGFYFTAATSGQFGATLFVRAIHSDTAQKLGRLVLGNNIPDGTAGASNGAIYIYGSGAYFAAISDKNGVLTANRELALPDKSGTIALTEEVDDSVKAQLYSAYGATQFTSNTDLNSSQYTAPGRYYGGTSIVNTMQNNPASIGCMMEVFNLTGTDMRGIEGVGSQYRIRRITDLNNNIFQQMCYTLSAGVANYGAWKKVTMTNA